MRIVYLFISFIVIDMTFSNDGKTYISLDEIINSTEKDPVKALIDILQSHKSFYDKETERTTYSYKSGYSSYNLDPLNKKADIVFVFVHGLFRNSAQFNGIRDYLLGRSSSSEESGTGTKLSFISLTLPGHPKSFPTEDDDSETNRFTEATHHDWVTATIETLKIAKMIGKTVVFFGRSTGGLIGVDIASHVDDLIDYLVVLEPAIKVRTPVVLVSSATSFLPKQLGIRSLFGREVRKLSNESSHYNYTEQASNVHVPSLVFMSETDRIVSPKAIDTFYQSLSVPKDIVRYRAKHGEMNTQDSSNFYNSFVANRMCVFLLRYVRISQCLESLYLELTDTTFLKAFADLKELTKIEDILQRYNEVIEYFKSLVEVVCIFEQDNCEEITTITQRLSSSYQGVLNRYTDNDYLGRKGKSLAKKVIQEHLLDQKIKEYKNELRTILRSSKTNQR